jgi:hypothetical protein
MKLATELGLEIAFSPRWWSFISSTRIFVESFCGHSIGEGAFSDRVALATYELLENAVKYSVSPDSAVRCAVSVVNERVRVQVHNTADLAHIPILEAEMATVQEGDPLDVYIQKMQRSVTQEQSQLGLARIRYESGAGLSMHVEGRLVTIEAQFVIPGVKG